MECYIIYYIINERCECCDFCSLDNGEHNLKIHSIHREKPKEFKYDNIKIGDTHHTIELLENDGSYCIYYIQKAKIEL